MEWLWGMDWLWGMVSGVMGTLVSTWLIRKLWPELECDTRKMIRRFPDLVQSRGVPPHQASRLLGESLPAAELACDVGIASVLTPERCDRLCDRLSLSNDWLIHGMGKPQSTWSIERSSHCWIDELAEAKQSHEITVIICRSEPVELADQPLRGSSQAKG